VAALQVADNRIDSNVCGARADKVQIARNRRRDIEYAAAVKWSGSYYDTTRHAAVGSINDFDARANRYGIGSADMCRRGILSWREEPTGDSRKQEANDFHSIASGIIVTESLVAAML
jgi:hypothetical protein